MLDLADHEDAISGYVSQSTALADLLRMLDDEQEEQTGALCLTSPVRVVALAAALCVPLAVERWHARDGLADPVPWSVPLCAGYALAVLGGMELISWLVHALFGGWRKIPVRGRHLDELSLKDRAFLAFNRLTTLAFMRHLVGTSNAADDRRAGFAVRQLARRFGK